MNPGPGRLATTLAATTFVVVLFNAYLLASVLAQLVLGFDRPRAAVTLAQLLGLLVPSLVALVVLARLGFRLPARRSLRIEALPSLVGVAAFGFVVALAAALLWTTALVATEWPWVLEQQRRAVELYEPLLRVEGAGDLTRLLVTAALVPATCEELAFRGCLQRLLRTRFGATASIGATAFLFAAMHGDVIGLPARCFLGISLGWALERTGSLLAPALVHGAHDLVAVSLAAVALSRGAPVASDMSLPHAAVPFAVATLALAFVAWLLALRLLPDAPA